MKNTRTPSRSGRSGGRAPSPGQPGRRPSGVRSDSSADAGTPARRSGKPAGAAPARPAKEPARTGAPERGQRPAGKPAPRPAAESAVAPGASAGVRPGVNRHNLIYGLHPVAAAWINPERRCRGLYVTESALAALDGAVQRAAELGLERPDPTFLEKEELDKLLPPGAVHQGVALDTAPLPEVAVEDVCIAAESEPQALVIVLDQVTDPHNVGAIMRSAAAFGARAVVVQDRHAPPVTGVLAKTASGAVDAVPLVRVTNLARALDTLKQAGFWTVGLDESGARPLHEVDLTGRTALVLGSEGEGLRRLTGERCDEIARLPTGGPVGSLNVSNAAAVALYEVARRR